MIAGRTPRRVVITGADGFIGRNLALRLAELGDVVLPLTRSSTSVAWHAAVAEADAVVHLAGANRPADPADFDAVNAGTATLLVTALEAANCAVPVLYASSTRASGDDHYGRSKRAGENALLDYGKRSGNPVYVLRLPNVFGKWARPNYNSAVATFCYNIARDLPITVNDPAAPLRLVYIDDVVTTLIAVLDDRPAAGFTEVAPIYTTTVGAVAETIRGFRADRADNFIDAVGAGLTRALYATYVAALQPADFSYEIASHRDPRGAFSEMLKTRSAGQFSYFTALPGVTRGGHYHHSKTEKFLIVHGKARFGFRHVLTGETHEILVEGETPTIVETVPGWAHDVTNIGDGVMISLLWANEIFDRTRPDTIAAKV
ncbi:NAD-dependent epimerase/dehydratase family protein [Sphingomonas sp. S1-29]|uniref:UDP-2-acetamido-2,6-beta-L-arabino-hexul-4-ose reductase n=1 Tax=Sphingomonas sp. S1-29 TaxID=2991074 RepID=UPI0022403DF5|nr:NAD-dependent epimerase/dehydratase family protein [Sphingomonas sp. S1-29]UZK68745.1 NAD-dependent epimerase/dehydratase family protein [Sphingomonas sp. S1-29]